MSIGSGVRPAATLLLSSILLFAPHRAANAADQSDPAAATAPPSEAEAHFDPHEMDIVKVTVDRREKDIQDYGGSASAYTQSDLERLGVNDVQNISNVAPGVQVGVQEGNVELFVRGIGNQNNTELGDPSSALHIDGVYIPRPRGMGSVFFDIERVEVNRGPQGTLRGRNATGGSMNIVTVKPKLKDFSAEASYQLGNYSQRLMKGTVNIPIGERLALRLAAMSESRDSFYKAGGPPPVDRLAQTSEFIAPENADNLAYRASAKWVPFRPVTLLVSQDFIQENGTGWMGSNFSAPLAAGLKPEEVPDARTLVLRGRQPLQRLRHAGVAANLTIDAGPVLFEALSSYRNLQYRQTTGGNAGVVYHGMPVQDLANSSATFWDTGSQSLVEEVRLFSPDRARFRWQTGGFFFHEKQHAFLGSVSDESNYYFGNEFNMPNVRSHSLAGYADGTLDILKNFRATGGARVTQEEKTRTGLAVQWTWGDVGMNNRLGTAGFQFAGPNRTYYPTPEQTMSSSFDPYEVFLNGVSTFGTEDNVQNRLTSAQKAATTVVPQVGRYKGTFSDFRGGLEFDATSNNLLYVTVSTGHKSGGFNDVLSRTDAEGKVTDRIAPSYKPESLLATEAGSKNEWFGKRFRLNAAVFNYEYRDMVMQQVIPTGPPPANGGAPPASLVSANLGRARITGLELESAIRLPFGFLIGAQALFLRAQIREAQVNDARISWNPAEQPLVNLAGHDLPRAPKYAVTYSLAQNIGTSIGYFDWIVSAQSRGSHFMTVFNGDGRDTTGGLNPLLDDRVPAYTRVDLGVGYTRPDGKARLEGFGSNVSNVTYMTSLNNVPGLNLRFFNTPRQVGVRLSLFW